MVFAGVQELISGFSFLLLSLAVMQRSVGGTSRVIYNDLIVLGDNGCTPSLKWSTSTGSTLRSVVHPPNYISQSRDSRSTTVVIIIVRIAHSLASSTTVTSLAVDRCA